MANFKKGSKAAKDFMAKIRAKKGVGKVDSKRQTGTTDKARDKKIQAKKPGKRIAKSSNKVYYERRANRSDKGQLLGVEKVTLNQIGAELLSLEFQILHLKSKKQQAKLIKDKKEIQIQISVYQKQFKALKSYLNTRAKFK